MDLVRPSQNNYSPEAGLPVANGNEISTDLQGLMNCLQAHASTLPPGLDQALTLRKPAKSSTSHTIVHPLVPSVSLTLDNTIYTPANNNEENSDGFLLPPNTSLVPNPLYQSRAQASFPPNHLFLVSSCLTAIDSHSTRNSPSPSHQLGLFPKHLDATESLELASSHLVQAFEDRSGIVEYLPYEQICALRKANSSLSQKFPPTQNTTSSILGNFLALPRHKLKNMKLGANHLLKGVDFHDRKTTHVGLAGHYKHELNPVGTERTHYSCRVIGPDQEEFNVIITLVNLPSAGNAAPTQAEQIYVQDMDLICASEALDKHYELTRLQNSNQRVNVGKTQIVTHAELRHAASALAALDAFKAITLPLELGHFINHSTLLKRIWSHLDETAPVFTQSTQVDPKIDIDQNPSKVLMAYKTACESVIAKLRVKFRSSEEHYLKGLEERRKQLHHRSICIDEELYEGSNGFNNQRLPASSTLLNNPITSRYTMPFKLFITELQLNPETHQTTNQIHRLGIIPTDITIGHMSKFEAHSRLARAHLISAAKNRTGIFEFTPIAFYDRTNYAFKTEILNTYTAAQRIESLVGLINYLFIVKRNKGSGLHLGNDYWLSTIEHQEPDSDIVFPKYKYIPGPDLCLNPRFSVYNMFVRTPDQGDVVVPCYLLSEPIELTPQGHYPAYHPTLRQPQHLIKSHEALVYATHSVRKTYKTPHPKTESLYLVTNNRLRNELAALATLDAYSKLLENSEMIEHLKPDEAASAIWNRIEQSSPVFTDDDDNRDTSEIHLRGEASREYTLDACELYREEFIANTSERAAPQANLEPMQSIYLSRPLTLR